jgi:hypothetical protein
MKKATVLGLTLILLACTAMALFTTVQASDPAVSLYVNDPFSQASGNKGQSCGGYWVGEIPITLTNSTGSYPTMSYCMDFDRVISVGGTYPASITGVPDNAEWRAVSYLLTWNKPADNSQAAADQIAVWRILNQTRGTPYYRESWLDPSLDDAGSAVAAQAYGRDVVRAGDVFRWVSPISNNMSTTQANAGQTVAFTAQLTTSTGAPRPNVKVVFNATLTFQSQTQQLNSTYITPLQAFTDSQGQVQVNVKVPADSLLGSNITVAASTQSVWPQKFVDVTDPSIQDLIGMGDTFQLTVSTNVCILGYIQVLPEAPIGTLLAVTAVGSGYVIWVKVKHPKKQQP